MCQWLPEPMLLGTTCGAVGLGLSQRQDSAIAAVFLKSVLVIGFPKKSRGAQLCSQVHRDPRQRCNTKTGIDLSLNT